MIGPPFCRALSTAFTSLLLAAAGWAAQDESTADSASLEEGKLLYRVHCQGCHGESAKGNGPLRDQLETPPPDLTRIRQRNNGEFPPEKIHKVIDGRTTLPTHGSREMPVWGFTFQALGRDTDQESEVLARITALTRYLESIQERVEQ